MRAVAVRQAAGDGRAWADAVQRERITASGLEVRGPAALRVGHVLVDRPRAVVARDRTGRFPVQDLWTRRGAPAAGEAFARPASPAAPRGAGRHPRSASRSGRSPSEEETWRGVTTPADAGAAWRVGHRGGRVGRRLAAARSPGGSARRRPPGRRPGAGQGARGPGSPWRRSPGGGEQHRGRRVPPLPSRRRQRQWTGRCGPGGDGAPTGVAGTTVRGRAGLSGLDVRDGRRTLLRVERALAEGVDVAWPRRIAAGLLHLERPWVLVERDERGALPLRKLFTAAPNATAPKATSPQVTGTPRSGAPSMAAGEPARINRRDASRKPPHRRPRLPTSTAALSRCRWSA